MATATVKVRGVPLEVDFSYPGASIGGKDSLGVPEEPNCPTEADIEEVRLEGWEILCIMSDEAVTQARNEILKEARK